MPPYPVRIFQTHPTSRILKGFLKTEDFPFHPAPVHSYHIQGPDDINGGMSIQSGRASGETLVHVGNRILAKDCFIGLSTSVGRVLIRAVELCLHNRVGALRDHRGRDQYSIGDGDEFRPLINREMGCGWAVVKVLREAPFNSTIDRPPTKVTATVECLDTDRISYICCTPSGERVRVHQSDIKEMVGVLAEGQKLEMVLCSKRGPTAKNELQVCCIASIVCPGGLATTQIKLEVSPIEIASRCPEKCTTSILLKGLVQAAGGINAIWKELGSQFAEEIKLLTMPKREAPE